jgi:hypothetical protein
MHTCPLQYSLWLPIIFTMASCIHHFTSGLAAISCLGSTNQSLVGPELFDQPSLCNARSLCHGGSRRAVTAPYCDFGIEGRQPLCSKLR